MSKRCFVIKCGGSTLAELPSTFYDDLKYLQQRYFHAIVVHGGGPAINQMLNQLQIQSAFVDGLRVTDQATLEVVEMVLSGQINKQIVQRIQTAGLKAIGISGVDGQLLLAKPVEHASQIGYVGEILHVEVSIIHGLINMGVVPVIAPLGISIDNVQKYNINADTAAGAIASAIQAEQLVIVTDVPGILKSIHGEQKVLTSITVTEVEEMIQSGEIYGGMIPKVRAAIQCMQGNLAEVLIVDGKQPQILRKVFNHEEIGTRIRK